MEAEERTTVLNAQVNIWAKEAACCPVCKVLWTIETVRELEARVAHVEPRVLVCPGCWTPWLEICKFNVDQARKAGELP